MGVHGKIRGSEQEQTEDTNRGLHTSFLDFEDMNIHCKFLLLESCDQIMGAIASNHMTTGGAYLN